MTTTTIALNKLLAWDGNVRKTNSDKAISELAASIAAHGLLQSLVVRKDKRGKYAVVAGRRRLLALKSLAEDGNLPATAPITCNILEDEANAAEIGLAENVQREAMHPADEFDAFLALVDDGIPVTDIAARFGVTETVVQKRLKLARVSPKLLDAFRRGEMTLQHVMAFTVSDDHEAQERVWSSLPAWQKSDPSLIRDCLSEHEVTAADRRVRFVTLKAYEKADGALRRDLFSDGEDGVFILDEALLESLVAKKLGRTANAIRKEGWRWIEIRASFDHEEWSGYERFHPEPSPLPPDLQEEMDALNAEAEALSEIEELSEDQQARLDAVNERLDELDNREDVWSPETLAIAGAIVSLGHDGRPDIHRGFVKPEDMPQETPAGEVAEDGDASSAADGTSALSSALIESLTAHRSAALSVALLDHPEAALALLVERLALPVFYNGRHDDGMLQIAPRIASLHRVEGSPAFAAIEAARENWTSRLPADSEALLNWCFMQSISTLQGLLTFCVAQTVNAVLLKGERPTCLRMEQAKTVAGLLNLDMAAWFTPTSANYFSRASKATIIGNLEEIKGAAAPAWSAMKKTELASLAEREAARSRWVPPMLRPPESSTAVH
jgi:ParB family transcriptional regulator, chromosome partitioning protein